MKRFTILCLLLLAGLSFQLQAQNHRIVFQLTTADTLAHKALMKQLGNILTVSPGTQLEVVCHGPGLEMLQTSKSIVKPKLDGFIKKGVLFQACEFSMKERKVDRSELLPDASTVPAGIIHIVTKQEQGWSYIKAGF
jgi:intracellular sulfur oxidation DsrE/DsrF family protein